MPQIHRAELFFSFSVNFLTHYPFTFEAFDFLFTLLTLPRSTLRFSNRPQTLRHRHQRNRTGKMTINYVGSAVEWAECSWKYISSGWWWPFTLVGSKSERKPLTPTVSEAYLIIDRDVITKSQPITSVNIDLGMPYDGITIPCWGSVSSPRAS